MRYIAIMGAFAFAIAAVPAIAFDFADARHVVSVAEPRISPDGKRVVYVRGHADFEKDRNDRQLVLIDVQSRRSRQLTWDRKGVGSPRWSPDGNAIAFTALDSEKDPQEQIFVLPMEGGEARQVTHAKTGVNSFEWSPDGSHFAYTKQDEDPNKKNVEKHLDAFQVHDNDYLHDSATQPVHVWTIGADGKHDRRLTSGSWSVADVQPDGGGDITWSDDGRTIAVERFPTPFVGNSLDVYTILIDAQSGQIHRLTPGESLQNSPAFAPHGDRIAYARNTRGDYTQGTD
ncbi:MAG: PD40 domain-containing protein, partial [Candidatus Eremiobacteraeota bacterium]|nr:PD40 domain-containing protein [Candidatus Eremiobacteraeota bacterium]